MMVTALLAMAASTAGSAPEGRGFAASNAVRASATVSVRLVSAEVVPMSSDSDLEASQRRTTITLADGEHEAFIVEFQ